LNRRGERCASPASHSNEEKKMMRKLPLLAITIGLFACLGNISIADDKEVATGQWADPTLQQLMNFLGLDGGNITINFASPVHLNLRVVTKKGKGQPEVSEIDYWTDKPSMNYQLYAMVEDVKNDVVSKRISFGYKRAEIKRPGKTGVRTAYTSGGYEVNWILLKAKQWRVGGAWRNREMEVSIDEPVVLYELTDFDAPTNNYNKLIIRFSESLPPKKK